MRYGALLTCALLPVLVAFAGCSKVDDPTLYPRFNPATAEPPPEKPTVDFSATRNLLWGDLHIHTSLSYDAFTMGVRALPEDAYTYMKGGTIEHGMGYAIRASRPLDFGAVTDHAEYLGVARHIGAEDADNFKQNQLRAVMETGSPLRITWNFLYTVFSTMSSSEKRQESFGRADMEEVSQSAWREIIDAAGRHNDPGRFTSFIAYEWTSMPSEDNLHRNVVYKTTQVPDFPFSSLDSDNPEDLWQALERQRQQGMEVFAIPHNGNVSNGRMYQGVKFDGSGLSADYAKQRMANEPISEIFQVKGSSETHPQLSPSDDFAGFEIYDQRLSSEGGLSEPSGSYARDALRTGIELAHSEGFNPYRFGVIGSSDSHNASSSVEEDNYHGKLPLIDGTAGLRLGETLLLPEEQNRGGRWSAAGLAAVWAEENTRASLFEAMARKETYATSGPRIALRFFGGWQYDSHMLESAEWLEHAYKQGVAMGGELPEYPGQGTPGFILWAAKDPQGANLDRVQVIKAWVDDSGNSHERIYDVALSDDRKTDPDGQSVSDVGNTVDAAEASYSNSIGAGQLATIWQDADFDPAQEAFYYARAIEIPTPRYSTYDAKALGVEPPEPVAIQERAVSSAIWYQPQ